MVWRDDEAILGNYGLNTSPDTAALLKLRDKHSTRSRRMERDLTPFYKCLMTELIV
jgi:hypothetical protein